MAKGKKTSPEDVYKIMLSWATTGSLSDTARDLGIPISTVKRVVDDNKGKEEFRKLCDDRKQDFCKPASDVIDKGLILLDRRFTRAIEHEQELDDIIDVISSDDDIPQCDKMRIVGKLQAMQLQDVKAISTVIGTLYDKRALATGAATGRMDVEIRLPPEVDDFAG